MSGFEIRDFGLFVKTEQIETLSAWQKEREHYKILGTQYLVSWRRCITKYI
jgi:hypothetical protein